MIAISRPLLTTGASAAVLLAIAGIANGCRSPIDCHETAKCSWFTSTSSDGGVGDELGPVADVQEIVDVVGLHYGAVADDGNEEGDAANPPSADADVGATDVAVADGTVADATVPDGTVADATVADGTVADATADRGYAPDAPGKDGHAQLSDASGDGAPGAPPIIVLSPPALTSKHGGDGGTANVDACPGSQMVVGYLGTYTPTAYVDSIQVVCGMVLVTGSSAYQIIVSPGATLPSHGSTGGSSFTAMCPNNQVVVGIYGHSGLWVDQLGFECAPLTISPSATLAISTGTVTQLPASGGPGGGAFGDTCPSGQVAVGNDVASGSFVDSIALRCAAPTLVWPDM